ncbi:LysR family transcriptional regulator [Nocardia sp. NEAU-G5]|uniref:LysR family transcriptional regulator n=1 Tax=Nocardia albiluteola TaxID=2842303 RepID=A0ABS6BCF7_9NOCA|nr:LysR substrate-binding domain-containing protein [Nocardia albiluteola]MBU3067967.1 LysR family transcriptional regulator [Nocardia albiluteola]
MERHEIEAFLAVADELHFGRAAERLHVSTGRISQTIKVLERRFGAALFERTSRRVALTPIGRQFYEDLLPGVEQIRTAVCRATAAGRGLTGTLDIGFVGAAAGELILEVHKAFRAEHPDIEVRIREIQINDGLDGWRRDTYDMALTGRPIVEPDLVVGPTLIFEDRMLALPAAHPLAARSSLSLEDLAEVTLLRMPRTVPDALLDDRIPSHTPNGRPIAHGPIAHTFQEILAMIGAGTGAFVVGAQVTRFYLRPGVRYVPFRDAPPVEWGFVWLRARETVRVRAFAAAAARLTRDCRSERS